MKKNKFLIPITVLGSMFLAVATLTAVPSAKGKAVETKGTEREVINPIASYQFNDSSNPGKDSMGNYDLEAKGGVTASGGVATFDGSGTLRGMAINNAIGSNDFTIKLTVKMSGCQTYAVGAYKSYWSAGDGFSITNWAESGTGSLLGSFKDGEMKAGTSADWGTVIANDSSEEHTVILSVENGGIGRYYVDGQNVKSFNVSSNFTLAGADVPFALGARSWGDTVANGMTGTMKNVKIYNVAVNDIGANDLFTEDKIYQEVEENFVAPIASYQFNDSTNPGKDSMGNFNLTNLGGVTAADGVATFNGSSALISDTLLGALGASDVTVKATMTMSGSNTFAVNMFTDTWCTGKGLGIQNWGGALRGSVDDGTSLFGNDHCWTTELAGSAASEHTVIISVGRGKTADLYCDGKLIDSKACSNDFTFAGSVVPFTLGAGVWNNAVQGFAMNGTLKDVKIYNTSVNQVGAHCLFKHNKLLNVAIGDQDAIAPYASYQFKDSSNPGKDSAGNHDLTNIGGVTAADGVATFNGSSALVSDSMFADLGATDITVKATMTMSGSNTFAVNMFTSTWANGKGLGIQNWGGALRGAVDDGTNLFGGGDHCWTTELAASAASEHTVIISVARGGKALMYCDDSLKASANASENFTFAGASVPFTLGAGVWSNAVQGFGMDGTLKDVKIYKRTFNEVEIGELFALGDAFESSTAYVETVENPDYSSTMIVPTGATKEAILTGYAPQGKQKINVTMSNGAEKTAYVTWDDVVTIGDETFLKGTLSDIKNDNNVVAYAKITVRDSVEILPIAKYDFASAENIGKDAMGNYDLEVYRKNDQVNISVDNGAAVFDGNYFLFNDNLAKDLKGKGTISFDIQLPGNVSGWQSPFSFGRNGWTCTEWNLFEIESGTTRLRYGACTELTEDYGQSNIDYTPGSGQTNADWYPVIGMLGSEKHNVTLTAGDQNRLRVYFDNALVYDYELPEDFTFEVDTGKFSIGGTNNIGLYFNGKISNFLVYNFPVTSDQIRILNAQKYIKDNTHAGKFIVSYGVPAFKDATPTTSEARLRDTKEEMLAKVNKATVVATMNDSTTETLNVIWKDIVKEGTKYYAVGDVDLAGKQYSVVPNQVKLEIPVASPFDVTTKTVAHGTVTTNVSEAYTGDRVVVTPTPTLGYVVDKVMVNGQEITPVEGIYSFICAGDSEVSATFVVGVSVYAAQANHGTVTVDQQYVHAGETVHVTVTPEEGYVIKEVKLNGVVIDTTTGSFDITVMNNVIVSATFEKVYSVSVGEVANGAVAVDKTTGLAGETVTVTATPNEGYELKEVKVNDQVLEAVDGEYTFVIGADAVVTATFEAIPEPTKGCGGSIIAASSLVSLLAVAGLGLVINKRKED